MQVASEAAPPRAPPQAAVPAAPGLASACALPEHLAPAESHTEQSDSDADLPSGRGSQGARGLDAAFMIGVTVLLVAAAKIAVQLVAGPLYGELPP